MKKYHLFLDADLKDALPSIIIELALRKIPKIMGMRTLGRFQIGEGNNNLPGFSGIQMIETSHIAIHSFDKQKKVWIDILSCKAFDKDKVINFLSETFRFTTVEIE